MKIIPFVLIPAITIVLAIIFFHLSNNSTSALCKGNAMCYNGTVTNIIDGDTIVVGQKHVRLSLVNTPEKNETGYNEAIEFMGILCPVGSNVLVDQDDLQLYSYNRMIGVVYCNGKIVNEEILKNNFGIILTDFCSKSEFENESWAIAYGC
jgi:micrococcal nuclease